MEHQDWNQVVWNKKKKPSYNHNPPGTAKFRALDGDEPPAPKKIDHSTRIAIQRARIENKLSQKQLANKLNIQEKIISEYESGKAIPNKQIINKINRLLNSKIK